MLLTASLSICGTTASGMESEARRRFTALLGPEANDRGEIQWRMMPASLIGEGIEVSNEKGEHEIVNIGWRGEFQAVTCR